MSELDQFILNLDSVDKTDNAKFKEICSLSETLLGLSDRDFAREFNVPVPSISRWRKGQSCPVPYIRKHVFEFIKNKALDFKSNKVGE